VYLDSGEDFSGEVLGTGLVVSSASATEVVPVMLSGRAGR
jgi:hypothetical protein